MNLLHIDLAHLRHQEMIAAAENERMVNALRRSGRGQRRERSRTWWSRARAAVRRTVPAVQPPTIVVPQSVVSG